MGQQAGVRDCYAPNQVWVGSDWGRTGTRHSGRLGFSGMDRCTDLALMSGISEAQGAYGHQQTLGSYSRQGPHSEVDVG